MRRIRLTPVKDTRLDPRIAGSNPDMAEITYSSSLGIHGSRKNTLTCMYVHVALILIFSAYSFLKWPQLADSKPLNYIKIYRVISQTMVRCIHPITRLLCLDNTALFIQFALFIIGASFPCDRILGCWWYYAAWYRKHPIPETLLDLLHVQCIASIHGALV